jgi:hypothetical protein
VNLSKGVNIYIYTNENASLTFRHVFLENSIATYSQFCLCEMSLSRENLCIRKTTSDKKLECPSNITLGIDHFTREKLDFAQMIFENYFFFHLKSFFILPLSKWGFLTYYNLPYFIYIYIYTYILT